MMTARFRADRALSELGKRLKLSPQLLPKPEGLETAIAIYSMSIGTDDERLALAINAYLSALKDPER